MAMADRSERRFMGVTLLVAGVVAIAGAFLTWVDLSSAGISFAEGSVSADPSGVGSTYGWVAVGGGAVLALAGLIRLQVRSRSLGFLAIVTAIVVGGVCGFVAATPQERFIDHAVDTAATEAFPADEVRREMETLYVQNAVQVSPGVGLYVSAAGAVLGLLGGIGLALDRSRPSPSAEGPAASHDFDVDERLATVLGTEPAVTDEVPGGEAPDPRPSTDEPIEEPTQRSKLGDSWSA